jgi:transposase
MHVEAHLSVTALKRLVRAEKDVKLSKRIQMVVLALEGYTAPAIARSLSVSRRICQHWVQQYNAHGLEGLHDKPGRGKSPLLTPSEQEQLKQRIDAGPTVGDNVCALRGKDIQRILEKEFGKARSLGAVYYLLHQLGYSSLVPRPQHRQADPEAQDDFKKSSPRSLPKSRGSDQANA